MLKYTTVRSAIVGLLCTLFLAVTAVADSPKQQINIPPGDLSTALNALVKQSGVDLVYRPEQVKGLKTQGVSGNLSVEDALTKLLAGTPLTVNRDSTGAVLISNPKPHATSVPSNPPGGSAAPVNSDVRVAQVQASETLANQSVPEAAEESKKAKDDGLSEIVVTGTLIHNVAPIAPVNVITHDDILHQGYTSLSQVIEQLPQNFSGGGSSPASNSVNGIGANAQNNYNFASGANLRGLGASATLVLLNGRRLAPTAQGAVVDISQIPVSIIDRVEILTDGASALYGSDAVAGVVNIITRTDFAGAEVGGRVTGMSEGKAPNYGSNILGGNSWSGGGLVANFDYERDNPLFARNRSFADQLPDPWALTPKMETYSFYLQAHQEVTDRLNVSGDALIGKRQYATTNLIALTDPAPATNSGQVKQYAASLQLDYRVADAWRASLIGQFSKEQDSALVLYPPYENARSSFDYRVSSVEPRVDGKLVDLPGGALRIALGGQFREEAFDNANTDFSGPSPVSFSPAQTSRNVRSAYGELLVPLVGSDNAVPLVQRLRIDVSERYDHYSDFGGTANPKVGVEWVPLTDLTLHATYARSFQAPTLYQVSNAQNVVYVAPNADPTSPTGSSLVLAQDATNPNLQPETAKSFNVGFTYIPSFVNGLNLDASWFSVDFNSRIVELSHEGFSPFTVLPQADLLGPLVQTDPSVGQVNQVLNSPGATIANFAGPGYTPGPFTPNEIKAIANIGFANAATENIRGVDLAARYLSTESAIGRFHVDVNATYFTRYEQQIAPGGQAFGLSNTLYNPLRLRAKANLGWERGTWAANARVNFSNAYSYGSAAEVLCATGGTGVSSCSGSIGSWTTVDLNLGFADVGQLGLSWLQGVRLSLSATNVFNRAPPTVQSPVSPNFGYDPVNANPLLRTFGVTFSKRWGGGPGK